MLGAPSHNSDKSKLGHITLYGFPFQAFKQGNCEPIESSRVSKFVSFFSVKMCRFPGAGNVCLNPPVEMRERAHRAASIHVVRFEQSSAMFCALVHPSMFAAVLCLCCLTSVA